MFEELVMGSGTMCQRCTQPNLQLAGGVELNASRLFRDRMYKQHGLIHPIVRYKSSSEGRTSRDLLLAYVIDNKRQTRKQCCTALRPNARDSGANMDLNSRQLSNLLDLF